MLGHPTYKCGVLTALSAANLLVNLARMCAGQDAKAACLCVRYGGDAALIASVRSRDLVETFWQYRQAFFGVTPTLPSVLIGETVTVSGYLVLTA